MNARYAVRDDATGPFFDAARGEELVIQKCSSCGHLLGLDARTCPVCESTALHWIPASGRGSVVTWTVVHRAPHPAFADLVPYTVGIVELAEGPWMYARITGTPHAAGDDVRVRFLHDDAGESIPIFQLVTGSGNDD